MKAMTAPETAPEGGWVAAAVQVGLSAGERTEAAGGAGGLTNTD